MQNISSVLRTLQVGMHKLIKSYPPFLLLQFRTDTWHSSSPSCFLGFRLAGRCIPVHQDVLPLSCWAPDRWDDSCLSRSSLNFKTMHCITLWGCFGFGFSFFELVAVLLNSSFLPQRNMSLGAGEIPI